MFFYAAKTLWFLAQPSSAIAIALTLGVVLAGTAWRRLGRGLLIGGFAALFVCGLSPLSDWLIVPLENRFARPDLDRGGPITGIIILGGTGDARPNPPRELAGLNEAAERMTEAVALARRFPTARVVFTGGSGALLTTAPPESVSMGALLVALGVAKERTTLESQSRDTYENAVFTKRLVNPGAGERWLLITTAWHMPRAMGCFRQAGFPAEPWPVDYRTSGRVEIWPKTGIPEGLRQMDFVMREYAGLVAYYLTGRIGALLPGP
jgi:uncharacterized SAM-binding protein YcdF (DUF218 family)